MIIFHRFTVCHATTFFSYNKNKLLKNGLNRRDYIYGGVWTSNETKENDVDPKDLYEGKNSIFTFDL